MRLHKEIRSKYHGSSFHARHKSMLKTKVRYAINLFLCNDQESVDKPTRPLLLTRDIQDAIIIIQSWRIQLLFETCGPNRQDASLNQCDKRKIMNDRDKSNSLPSPAPGQNLVFKHAMIPALLLHKFGRLVANPVAFPHGAPSSHSLAGTVINDIRLFETKE